MVTDITASIVRHPIAAIHWVGCFHLKQEKQSTVRPWIVLVGGYRDTDWCHVESSGSMKQRFDLVDDSAQVLPDPP